MSDDAHARPTGDAPEPLYKRRCPDTHARGARTNTGRSDLDRDLCTLALEPQGYPYGSFTPEEVRAALIAMVKEARSKLG